MRAGGVGCAGGRADLVGAVKSFRDALRFWLACPENRETLIVTFGLLALATVYYNPYGVLA